MAWPVTSRRNTRKLLASPTPRCVLFVLSLLSLSLCALCSSSRSGLSRGRKMRGNVGNMMSTEQDPANQPRRRLSVRTADRLVLLTVTSTASIYSHGSGMLPAGRYVYDHGASKRRSTPIDAPQAQHDNRQHDAATVIA
ncbi:hypothetical protein FA95DRAFT_856846 [Auriscalpium vulgare]|uniref:Uncharacterized protein n=1 Tax=Auriscalpium vulgare TaxID=40419 RepID=A0ACB8RZ40_9AGAM|nr:hypothetical protein FA95DRAFT_856846 [Auriscalpium vulgare]